MMYPNKPAVQRSATVARTFPVYESSPAKSQSMHMKWVVAIDQHGTRRLRMKWCSN